MVRKDKVILFKTKTRQGKEKQDVARHGQAFERSPRVAHPLLKNSSPPEPKIKSYGSAQLFTVILNP